MDIRAVSDGEITLPLWNWDLPSSSRDNFQEQNSLSGLRYGHSFVRAVVHKVWPVETLRPCQSISFSSSLNFRELMLCVCCAPSTALLKSSNGIKPSRHCFSPCLTSRPSLPAKPAWHGCAVPCRRATEGIKNPSKHHTTGQTWLWLYKHQTQLVCCLQAPPRYTQQHLRVYGAGCGLASPASVRYSCWMPQRGQAATGDGEYGVEMDAGCKWREWNFEGWESCVEIVWWGNWVKQAGSIRVESQPVSRQKKK